MTKPSPKTRKAEAAQAARVAELQRYRWKVAAVNGSWQVARQLHGSTEWEVLPERLEHHPDDDPVAERFRQAAWLRELLGHGSAWQSLDYAAQAEGREVYDLTILR